MIRFRPIPLFVAWMLGVALACDSSPSGPEGPVVRTGEPFELRAGESASIEGADLTVTFLGVTGDSRCPLNVACVWAGDASVKIRLRKAGLADAEAELHSNGDQGPQEVTHDGYRIAFRKLEPYPRDGVTITPRDYVLTLLASRA
jgi:hypothetical protein